MQQCLAEQLCVSVELAMAARAEPSIRLRCQHIHLISSMRARHAFISSAATFFNCQMYVTVLQTPKHYLFAFLACLLFRLFPLFVSFCCLQSLSPLTAFATTMDLLNVNEKTGLSLDRMRSTLIRLEDTIIFGRYWQCHGPASCQRTHNHVQLALIERAQFAWNPRIYQPGAFTFVDGYNGSFFSHFLSDVEKVHGM